MLLVSSLVSVMILICYYHQNVIKLIQKSNTSAAHDNTKSLLVYDEWRELTSASLIVINMESYITILNY